VGLLSQALRGGFITGAQPPADRARHHRLDACALADFDGLRMFFKNPVLPDTGHAGRNWHDDFQVALHIQDGDVRIMRPTRNILLTKYCTGRLDGVMAAHVAALRSFDELKLDIEECEVPSSLLGRLDASALTVKDLDTIDTAPALRPMRWHDYIYCAG
jgi:hypothetical protein